MKKVPRVSSFIGFYSLNIYKKNFVNSVDEFLNFIMNPNLKTEQVKVDKGNGELKYLEMKEKNLKYYYEKFCFMNQLTEKSLSDPENIQKFEKYGYTLLDEEEKLCQVFTKMVLKEEGTISDIFQIAGKDSLDVFIENFVNVTNFETDFEYIDEFTEKYNNFCDKFRLVKKEIRPNLLVNNIKYKFGTMTIDRKKLVKKKKNENIMKKTKFNLKYFLFKILTFGKYEDKNRMSFLIDEDQMKYHFDILIKPDDNSLFEDLEITKVSNQETEKSKEKKMMKYDVLNKMIYDDYWFNWLSKDIFMIVIQQVFTAICILPFFLLVILSEISYAPYSIIDPKYLITQ